MALVMYERLERYDHKTGAYKGSHVKLYDTVTQREGSAMSYATAETLGFTQTDILTQVQLGAVTAADEVMSQLSIEQASHLSTQKALQAEIDAHTATKSELSTLKTIAKIAGLI